MLLNKEKSGEQDQERSSEWLVNTLDNAKFLSFDKESNLHQTT